MRNNILIIDLQLIIILNNKTYQLEYNTIIIEVHLTSSDITVGHVPSIKHVSSSSFLVK